MNRLLRGAVFAVMCVMTAATHAFAQGGASSSLSGVVVDKDGGVIPGATVVVKNNATGTSFTVVTNSEGVYSVPALDIGTYTVTVSLQGFKTSVVNDVRLVAATPTTLRNVLEIGALSETVEVVGGSTLVQTQSTAVSSTLSVEQISNLPLVTRNALNFLTFLPGVDTASGPRNATINGLPQNTINVTVDGVNVNNNLQSGDGFYTMIRPQLDAVEEVTVTGATPGADGGGNGAVQVKFVTRSGTNALDSSIYHYFRHPSLNTNEWFNRSRGLDRNRVILHQFGGRVGGPIVMPGLYDGRGKAFFFFNYEEFRQPTEQSRTRTILHPLAQTGVFTWNTSSGTRQVNLLEMAAANGHVSTVDPLVMSVLNNIRAATAKTGTVADTPNDPNTQDYAFQAAGTGVEHLPTTRLDFNLTPSHRLSGSYYWQQIKRDPDILNGQEQRFPGFPTRGAFDSYRTTGSLRLRSTLSSSMVNEATFGWQWSPLEFATNAVAADFADQGGYALTLGFDLTDPTAASSNGPSNRNTVNWNIDNTLNIQRGAHSMSVGASFTRLTHTETAYNNVPTISFGVDQTNDPANAMFSTSNPLFTGASTTVLADARALYALLTGRVTAINGTARLAESGTQYVYLGPRTQRARLDEFGLFAQDTWRVSPTVTLNYGARWEVQLPFQPLNDAYARPTVESACGISGLGNGPQGLPCNMFNPQAAGGGTSTFLQYLQGDEIYKTDWNNIAPNVGIAWRPNVQSGFLRTILGDPEQATVRAAYGVSFTRNRMDEFTGIYGGNPGSTFNANRNVANGLLVPAGETWPVLLREQNRLGPPPIPNGPSYPIVSTVSNSINMISPDVTLGYVRSYSIGLQRALSRDMAIEVRYVGNQNVKDWVSENWNEINVIENGFLDEFRLAQQNLAAHVAAGCGGTSNPCSFAYRGPGTGTSPLPIYLAYFNRQPVGNAGDASRYTGGNWTNSTRLGELSLLNPNPTAAATALGGTATAALTLRANAIAAGLPANFFVMNPNASAVNVTRAVGGSRYHALQVEVRRRLANGLFANGSYAYSLRDALVNDTLRRGRVYELSTANNDGIRHAIKMTANYEIPVGRGRRFGTDMNAVMNGIFGDWMFNMAGRVQWRELSLTGVRLVGMTADELGDAYGFRIVQNPNGTTTVYSLPQDIIDNTIKAFSTDPTSPTGYGTLGPPTGRYIAPASVNGCIAIDPGDCGEPRRTYVMTPAFTRFDMSLKKRFPFGRKANFELEFDVLNVFNNINFTPVFQASNSNTLNQVTAAYQDNSNTFDPGGRLGQIIWRINF